MSAADPAQPRCTFLLRVDCEHTEAARWATSIAVERLGLQRLLALLRDLRVPATLAFVGETALEFPELARAAVAGGHAIAGHSMRHAGAYAGRPEAWQQQDVRAMVQAIHQACGIRIRGLAAPDHGKIDAGTIRAAALAGLDYVLNATFTAEGDAFAPAPGLPESVRVPPASMRVVWDWTALQPGWPDFSADDAKQRWDDTLGATVRDGGMMGLIVHPWIVETNDEYGLLADFLDTARMQGASFATFDEVVTPPAATAAGARGWAGR